MSPARRPAIPWETVRGPRAVAAVAVGTALGAGLFPFAPGTMGTLAALPLAWASAGWHWAPRLALWLAILAIGTWAARVIDETMRSSDNQCVVIDEVIGLGIAAWTAGTEPKTLIAAFLFFRFFDIVKPPPVRAVDRWSKKQSSPWAKGFGVMADDILAGFQALAVIAALQYSGILP
jgi:phosphatidylglycerophosphatase A